MNSENTIAKTIKVVSVMALIIGASGCATQGTGGSKLDNQELVSRIAEDKVQVCKQFGAVKYCNEVDRERAREEMQYILDSQR